MVLGQFYMLKMMAFKPKFMGICSQLVVGFSYFAGQKESKLAYSLSDNSVQIWFIQAIFPRPISATNHLTSRGKYRRFVAGCVFGRWH